MTRAADPREFHPAMVRLEALAPSPLGRRMLWAVLLFLAGLIAWAVFGRLDIVAVAEGRLVPDTYLKIVQPADAGVVKEILVKEGELVREGQVLMRMDAALSDSDLKTLAADFQNKRLSLRRIDAQLAGTPLTRRADDPPELFAQVQAQYLANRQAYQSALAQERALLDKARSDRAAAAAIKKKLAEVLPYYREQEAAYAKLERGGFAGRLMLTDKQRERIEKEQDLRAQEAVIDSAAALSAAVMDVIRQFKKLFPDTPLIAGNVATYEGTRDLIELGVDAIFCANDAMARGALAAIRSRGLRVPEDVALAEAFIAGRR